MDKEKIKQARDLLNEVLGEDDNDLFPIPEEQLVWKNGNLWKPESESDGKLVVLLREDWPQPRRVTALTDTGMWIELYYAGSEHNGGRHHYRGQFPGKDYAGKRKGGGARVYFDDSGDFGFIPIPGPPKYRWD